MLWNRGQSPEGGTTTDHRLAQQREDRRPIWRVIREDVQMRAEETRTDPQFGRVETLINAAAQNPSRAKF